jgi:hypothetical protein
MVKKRKESNMDRTRITEIIVIIVAVLAIISAGVSWWHFNHPLVQSKTEFVNVPQIKVVEKIKTVMVPMAQVETISKPELITKLKLQNEEFANNPDKQGTTTGVIAPYDGKTDVVSVINTKTGKSEIVAKQEPLPFFAFEDKKEIGARYGLSIKNSHEIDVYGRWDFVRIGNVHVGVYGDANTAGDAKAMISVGYKW